MLEPFFYEVETTWGTFKYKKEKNAGFNKDSPI